MFLIIIMQALFALTFPLGKLALQTSSASFLIAVRMMIGGTTLLLFAMWQNRREFSRVREDWFLFVQTSLFYIYLSFVPEFLALEKLSAIKVNLLWSSLPFVSALLSYYLLHERLSSMKWVGLIIGLLGMIPIMQVVDVSELGLSEFLHISYPELLMGIAVVSTAYSWFLVKQLIAKGYSLAMINGVAMVLGGIMSFATSLGVSHVKVMYTDLSATLWYASALVLIANLVAYPLYGYLLNFYSITLLSFSGFLCPVLGAFLSRMILHETLHIQYAIALLFIFGGLYIFYRDETRKQVE